MRRHELASGLVARVLLTTSAGKVVAQDEDVRIGDPVTDSSDGPALPDDRVAETDDSALDPPSDPAALGDASIDMSLAPADSCVGAAAHTITGQWRFGHPDLAEACPLSRTRGARRPSPRNRRHAAS